MKSSQPSHAQSTLNPQRTKMGNFFLKAVLNLCQHFLNGLYPAQIQAISLSTDSVISETKGTADKGKSIINTDCLTVISKYKKH